MNAMIEVDPATERRELFSELGLTMKCTFVPFSKSRNAVPKPNPNPNPKDMQLNWKVELMRNDRVILTTDYSQGLGHMSNYSELTCGRSGVTILQMESLVEAAERGCYVVKPDPHPHLLGKKIKLPEPLIDDVLCSLVLDSSAIDHANFESWADDCGYETDSRKAEAIYKACLDIGLAIRAAVGSDGLQRLQEVFQDY